jgi:N-acetylmuramoyl-L-alanine amidase
MTITDRLLTLGASHGRPGTKMEPKGIVVHYVGNPGSTAIANRNYFENNGTASSQYIVDISGEIIRCIPDNEVAWHAGVSYGAQWNAMAQTNNSRFIGIECCHPDANGKYSDKTCTALVELCATLCNKYGFTVAKDVYRHYDVTGKSCPMWYVKNPADWEKLKTDIAQKLNQIKQPGTPTPAPPNNKPSDWAAEPWAWAVANKLNDGTRPRDTTTREEVAAFVWRASKFLASK